MSLRRLLGVVLGLLCSTLAHAAAPQQSVLDAVAFHQRLGDSLPAGVRFINAQGDPVPLLSLARERPLILVLSWFDCPNLCPMVLDHLAAGTRDLDLSPSTYQVAVISIAPEESARDAQRIRQHLGQRQGEAIAGWQFLTGEPEAIAATTRAVGFQYAYDAERARYAHPAGLVVIAPGGTISRYLFDIGPQMRDLKLALLDAGQGKLGSLADRVLLRCYRFDPQTGRYTLTVVGILQVVGVVFVLLLAVLLLALRIRERR